MMKRATTDHAIPNVERSKPANYRDWQPDNAKTAYGDINGDQFVIHDPEQPSRRQSAICAAPDSNGVAHSAKSLP